MPSKSKNNTAYKYVFGPPSPDSPDVRKSRRVDKVESRCFHKDTCIGKCIMFLTKDYLY